MCANLKKWWLWRRIREYAPLFLAILVLLSSEWAANALPEIIGDRFNVNGWLANIPFLPTDSIKFAAVIFFLIFAWLLYNQRGFFRPRTRFMKTEVLEERRNHLVLFLSNLQGEKIKEGEKEIEKEIIIFAEAIPDWVEMGSSLKEYINAITNGKEAAEERKARHWRWPWEMSLRAILHHVPKLESITIACSPESLKQVKFFCELLGIFDELAGVDVRVLALKDMKPTLVPCSSLGYHNLEGLDFEDFDALSGAILCVTHKLGKSMEKEIMIDFTGGYKVTSVVAAAVTFNTKIKAQYVQTNSPWKLKSYDVIMSAADAGELRA